MISKVQLVNSGSAFDYDWGVENWLTAAGPSTIDVDSNNNKITTPTKDESHYRKQIENEFNLALKKLKETVEKQNKEKEES